MTRPLAILGAIFCFAMIFPMAATENMRGDIDLPMVIIHVVSKFVLTMSLLFYCGFAALHSVSHVEDPGDRVGWILLTIGINVVGSLVYYLTKYQDFRSHGMGGLIRRRKNNSHSFYRATPSELKAEQNAGDQSAARLKLKSK
ncbi:MAG: hypothetical protein QM496_03650 [Verrucomicrobiota bacterium]